MKNKDTIKVKCKKGKKKHQINVSISIEFPIWLCDLLCSEE